MTERVDFSGITPKCVKCGFCCTRGPCSWGEWDAEKGRCAYLGDDMLCKLYDQIVEAEKDSLYPMFGSGCSSPMFNTMREAKLKEVRSGEA